MCDAFAWYTMRSESARIALARARELAKSTLFTPYLLLNEVRDIRIEGQPTEPDVGQIQPLQEGGSFTRELGGVQLVEGDDAAPDDAGIQMLQRGAGWFIDVEIQVQQADQKMWIVLHVAGDGLASI